MLHKFAYLLLCSMTDEKQINHRRIFVYKIFGQKITPPPNGDEVVDYIVLHCIIKAKVWITKRCRIDNNKSRSGLTVCLT